MTVRVETVAIGPHYCAVFRTAGKPDEFLVDADGKPQRFATASLALRHGRKAVAATKTAPTPEADPFGIRTWRAERDADLKAERERVFGTSGPVTLERGGRTVVIERRRRR